MGDRTLSAAADLLEEVSYLLHCYSAIEDFVEESWLCGDVVVQAAVLGQ